MGRRGDSAREPQNALPLLGVGEDAVTSKETGGGPVWAAFLQLLLLLAWEAGALMLALKPQHALNG